MSSHFNNYKQQLQKSSSLKYIMKDKFSFNKMSSKIKELFDKVIPEFPQQVKIVLPKLKKIQLPKIKIQQETIQENTK